MILPGIPEGRGSFMPPLSLMIKPVSSACTMRCRYCFYTDVASNRETFNLGKMSMETTEKLIRRAMAYADGHVSFAFQGGEPTLAGIEYFREFIRLEKKYRKDGVLIQNSIQTNGYCLDDALLKFLVQEDFLIGVSVDGTAELHDLLRLDTAGNGTYSKVKETLDRLDQLKANFNILTVVNGYVARNASACFQSLSKYGYLQFIPCLDPFDGSKSDFSLTAEAYGKFLRETFDLYYKAFKRGKPVSVRNFDNYIGIILGKEPENCGMCGRCGHYFLIEGDGGIYPCDFYVLDDWYLGNINESSFFRLDGNEVGERFRKVSHCIADECRKCQWYSLCRGGCRRDREPIENGLPSVNQWCSSFKSFFAYAYPRMCEIAHDVYERTYSTQ